MNKKALATIMVLGVIISVGYFSTTSVAASDLNTGRDTLITRISQRFNLNKSDVEAVFDAIHDERRSEINAKRAERLSQAVKDGVITEAQKNALLAKMEDRAGKRHERAEEMQKWFSDQGIDHAKLRSYLGFGKGHIRGLGIPR